ncbi:YkgJ family cysteine cluster protein [Candidatus Altiarchaeota archaeon]
MLGGWLRRRYFWYLRRDYVREQQKRKVGECKRCGHCCSCCPFFRGKTRECRIYNFRPAICREYMLTPEDKRETPDCGFRFEE